MPGSGRSPTTEQPQVSVELPDRMAAPTMEPCLEESHDRRLTTPQAALQTDPPGATLDTDGGDLGLVAAPW